MKLVADDKIPHVSDFFTQCDTITLLPGESITRQDLIDADALLTRTVTTVNADLLHDTAIRFVGTATTGVDHIDQTWLTAHGIALATAAGANSQAVLEYVVCCIMSLKKKGVLQHHKTAGIIGCGRIGRLVADYLINNGFDVIGYDPLLTYSLDFPLVSLDELLSRADIISIHTPLTKSGLFPTFHMLNATALKKIKEGAILINTSRGSVIDQTDLLKTDHIILCLDVWENEPIISLELLNRVLIGTPHIAGYSMQAKYRATEMIYDSAADFFGWKKIHPGIILPKQQSNYDPMAHTQLFRQAFSRCNTSDDIAKVFVTERRIVR